MKLIRKVYLSTDSLDGISYPTLVDCNKKLLCHKNPNMFCKNICSAFSIGEKDDSQRYFVCCSPSVPNGEIIYEIIEKPVEDKKDNTPTAKLSKYRCTAPDDNECKKGFSNGIGCFAGLFEECEFRKDWSID